MLYDQITLVTLTEAESYKNMLYIVVEWLRCISVRFAPARLV